MASPTFQAVSGLAARRAIEPGPAASSDPDDEQEATDMPRRKEPTPMPPGPEREARIIELYNQGLTTKEIREAVGLTYDSAIYLALKNAGITPNRNGPYAPRGNHTNGTVEAYVEPEPTAPEPQALIIEEDTVPEVDDTVVVLHPDTPVHDQHPATYVLRVLILRPVVESVEVDVAGFDEAVQAAHALPGVVSILGVVAKDALKNDGGTA